MSGNSFGVLYCVTSFGESHGPAYGGVVDGCPPGLELAAADIQRELDRRKPGTSRHVTQRRESDTIELLSGIYEGKTTGTAIGFLIRNEDQRSKDYSAIADKFRPGHADYTYLQKYGVREAGDSCGARVNVVAQHVPVGWGEPVYGRLDADIAAAMMGINAVKGVEIGAGFGSITQKGSEHGDEMTPQGFLSNHNGGVLGGISTGQEITVSIALKPTSSIRLPRRTIDTQGTPVTIETTGRHDPCVGIRATPIAEAMLACVLMDHALRHRAQCGDVTPPLSFPGGA